MGVTNTRIKIQDGGWPSFKKIEKIAISQQLFDRKKIWAI